MSTNLEQADISDSRDKSMATKNTKSAKQNRPLCPRCTRQKWKADMNRYMNTANWHCQKCGVTWDNRYLKGWNDGYEAAQHLRKGPNDQDRS